MQTQNQAMSHFIHERKILTFVTKSLDCAVVTVTSPNLHPIFHNLAYFTWDTHAFWKQPFWLSYTGYSMTSEYISLDTFLTWSSLSILCSLFFFLVSPCSKNLPSLLSSSFLSQSSMDLNLSPHTCKTSLFYWAM